MQDVTHLRWRGLLPPSFIHKVLETIACALISLLTRILLTHMIYQYLPRHANHAFLRERRRACALRLPGVLPTVHNRRCLRRYPCRATGTHEGSREGAPCRGGGYVVCNIRASFGRRREPAVVLGREPRAARCAVGVGGAGMAFVENHLDD